jgi:hypothetical protein
MSDCYSGWTNKETFDAHMWISSNESIAKYYDHMIERAKLNDIEPDKLIRRVEVDMRELISEQLLSSEFTSDIVRQLANSSFTRIDFERMATLYVVETVPVDFS